MTTVNPLQNQTVVRPRPDVISPNHNQTLILPDLISPNHNQTLVRR